MSPAGTFADFQIAGGGTVQRIPVEAFPGFWAYVYLVKKDAYCVLIDAGSGTDTSHENLLSGFQKAGIQPADLTHLFLTHAHLDHMGGLPKVRRLTEARLGCHEWDAQTVAEHETRVSEVEPRLASFLAETGLAEEAGEQMLSLYRYSRALYQSVPLDFTYEALDMQLGPFEFVHLPGHCPGHVAIRLDDVIFCGDMVVEGVTPHLAPKSIHSSNGLDLYLKSLARFQDWAEGARVFFNGHGEVISDLPAQVEATQRNIMRRMRRAVEALREPLTMEQVCRAVYGETSGYNQLLVIEKTGAYVEYLSERGMIEIVHPGELAGAGAARYQRVRDEMSLVAELERYIYRNTRIQTHG